MATAKYKYGDAFHALCPYFAMFPPTFANEAIKKYSKPGDWVLDPFSGRGTTLFEARLLGRNAIANDINPVAVAITDAKTKALNKKECLRYVNSLDAEYATTNFKSLKAEAKELPVFFRHAYHPDTLLQILFLKKKLKQVRKKEAIFVKTLCLSYLHGEFQKTKQIYFSNNLPHTYCPKPGYSIKFWEERDMHAPQVNVFDSLRDRTEFRLSNSTQDTVTALGYSILGDVRKLDKKVKEITDQKIQLVVTSPPYLKITSYEEDQWLRLWFLGGPSLPTRGKITQDDRIASEGKYVSFLGASLAALSEVMKENGHIVCRIGQSSRDKYDLKNIIIKSIAESGKPFRIVSENYSAFQEIRQAKMFGKKYAESGEFDFVIRYAS